MIVLCLLENVYIDMQHMNILYNKAVGVFSKAKQSGFILLCSVLFLFFKIVFCFRTLY